MPKQHYSQPTGKATTGKKHQDQKSQVQKSTNEEDPSQARRQEADRGPLKPTNKEDPWAGSKTLKPTNKEGPCTPTPPLELPAATRLLKEKGSRGRECTLYSTHPQKTTAHGGTAQAAQHARGSSSAAARRWPAGQPAD